MTTLKYRADIDGLRAIAVLPILLFHAGISGFDGGYVGVDIFFVISGFLITSIILREVNSGEFTFTNFWARRARRILPAAIVVIVSTLIAGWFLLAPQDYEDLGKSAQYQAFFGSNLFFLKESGYFDGPSELKPLLHTWSLAVEEQFYMVFPLLFILLNKLLTKQIRPALCLVALVSFVISVKMVKSDPSGAFYLLHSRAWELLVGSILAFTVTHQTHSNKLYDLVGLLGLAVIGYCVISYDASTVFPASGALLPTFGAAAIIWANSKKNTIVLRVLSIKPLVWVGLISYSLYLWHWPIMAYTRYSSTESFLLVDKIVMVAVSFLAAYFSWRFIETPFRKYKIFPTNKKILFVALIGITVLTAFTQFVERTEGYPSRLPEKVLNYAMGVERSESQIRCQLEKLEKKWEKNICKIGISSNKPTIMVWGDSHATAMLPEIVRLAKLEKEQIIFSSYGNCIPVIGAEAYYKNGTCEDFNQMMYSNIERLKIKKVVLISRWNSYLYGKDKRILAHKREDKKDTDIAKNIFQNKLASFINTLKNQGVKVWLVKQVPLQDMDVSHHLTKLAMKGVNVSDIGVHVDKHLERQSFVSSVFSELADEQVVILDPTPYFCKNNFCPAQEEGNSLYVDDDHISLQGVKKIEGLFDTLFDP